MTIAAIERQAAVVDTEKLKLANLCQATVEKLSPVKVGDTVETNYYGCTPGIVESLKYRRGWQGKRHYAEVTVRLFSKGGKPGKRIATMSYELSQE